MPLPCPGLITIEPVLCDQVCSTKMSCIDYFDFAVGTRRNGCENFEIKILPGSEPILFPLFFPSSAMLMPWVAGVAKMTSKLCMGFLHLHWPTLLLQSKQNKQILPNCEQKCWPILVKHSWQVQIHDWFDAVFEVCPLCCQGLLENPAFRRRLRRPEQVGQFFFPRVFFSSLEVLTLAAR